MVAKGEVRAFTAAAAEPFMELGVLVFGLVAGAGAHFYLVWGIFLWYFEKEGF